MDVTTGEQQKHVMTRHDLTVRKLKRGTCLPKGAEIRYRREQKGWGQEQLANTVGYSASTIQRVEAGKPTYLKTLADIAQALGCELKEIMVVHDEQQPPQPEQTTSPERTSGAARRPPRENLTGQYIVGRRDEIDVLSNVVKGTLPHVVNIYGPGGIGKTVVCHKFEEWCRQDGTPCATVTGSDPTASTVGQLLSHFKEGLEENVPGYVPEGAFDEFAMQFRDYMAVEEVIARGSIFNLAGNPRRQSRLKKLLDEIGGVREHIEPLFDHRMRLERYTGMVDPQLTNSFVQSVTSIVEEGSTKVVLLVDTYELMEGLDDWMCDTFVSALPKNAKVIILGRNKLSRQNHDWSQYGQAALSYHELRELREVEAKDYLRHHGLQDEHSLDSVYGFTRGYPLCLALAVDLSRDLGSREEVRGFKGSAQRDRVAQQLLERILRQQEVEEVREFLEKGVVTEWFDPGLVSCVLEVTPDTGREVYDKIGKFSFVELHPQGLQFHDTVRKILVERLKFMVTRRPMGAWSGSVRSTLGPELESADDAPTQGVKSNGSKLFYQRQHVSLSAPGNFPRIR